MCLIVDHEKLKKFEQKVKHPKWYIFYKGFDIFDGKLTTPYQQVEIDLSQSIVKAKGWLNVKIDSFNLPLINGGVIHAKTTINFNDSKFDCVLSIKVHHTDIVSFGFDYDVCFWKYQFTNKSLKRLKKMGLLK